jgi:hypothetical protein
LLKVSKSRKQFMVTSILPKNERKSLSWASSLLSFVCFFGRIEETISCFRDLLTFKFQINTTNFQICTEPDRNAKCEMLSTLLLRIVSSETIFLNLEIVKNSNFNILPNKLNFFCGNYSRKETIQRRKLYGEIW